MNTVWTKQISTSLQWFQAFFTSKPLPIERYFRLDAYLRQGTVVEIGTDASPYGMGGWLTIDGVLTNYFATDISDEDEQIYGCPRGTSNGQQLWEALAILVAVDIWASQWQQHRIILKVRGDNIGALTLLIKMRPDNAKMAIVARGLALRMIELSFRRTRFILLGLHTCWQISFPAFMPQEEVDHAKTCTRQLPKQLKTVAPARKPSWYQALNYEPVVGKR